MVVDGGSAHQFLCLSEFRISPDRLSWKSALPPISPSRPRSGSDHLPDAFCPSDTASFSIVCWESAVLSRSTRRCGSRPSLISVVLRPVSGCWTSRRQRVQAGRPSRWAAVPSPQTHATSGSCVVAQVGYPRSFAKHGAIDALERADGRIRKRFRRRRQRAFHNAGSDSDNGRTA
jgi:hypothetical protein